LPDGILVSVQGKDYFLSFERLPWFKTAKVSDIMNVVADGDDAICWETLDVGLEIDSLRHPEKYPMVMKRYEGENMWKQ
jgi:hypothetical protein